jgi:hypothetical protein
MAQILLSVMESSALFLYVYSAEKRILLSPNCHSHIAALCESNIPPHDNINPQVPFKTADRMMK